MNRCLRLFGCEPIGNRSTAPQRGQRTYGFSAISSRSAMAGRDRVVNGEEEWEAAPKVSELPGRRRVPGRALGVKASSGLGLDIPIAVGMHQRRKMISSALLAPPTLASSQCGALCRISVAHGPRSLPCIIRELRGALFRPDNSNNSPIWTAAWGVSPTCQQEFFSETVLPKGPIQVT